uniref:Uncharacterized protein n=1 Tax=Gibberella zeae TaxID=5518 RepID=A0A4E9DUZ6_GIBZA
MSARRRRPILHLVRMLRQSNHRQQPPRLKELESMSKRRFTLLVSIVPHCPALQGLAATSRSSIRTATVLTALTVRKLNRRDACPGLLSLGCRNCRLHATG